MMKLAMIDVGRAMALMMRRAQIREEKIDHDDGQQSPVQDVEQHVVHGVANEGAVVLGDGNLEIGGEVLLQALELGFERFGDPNGVAAGLLQDVEPHGPFAVHPREARPFFYPVDDLRHLGEMDDLAARDS